MRQRRACRRDLAGSARRASSGWRDTKAMCAWPSCEGAATGEVTRGKVCALVTGPPSLLVVKQPLAVFSLRVGALTWKLFRSAKRLSAGPTHTGV